MAFKKGASGNPGGRPPGAKNKVNEELRDAIADFLNGEFAMVKQEFTRLNPRDKLKFFTELLPYTVPRLQNTTLATDFEKLTDEQLDEIIDKLKAGSSKSIGLEFDEINQES